MMEDLKFIFIKKIERNTWLSPSTKKSALKKLKKEAKRKIKVWDIAELVLASINAE